MDDYPFFALIARMKYIERWKLMRNSYPENIQEHSHITAVIAHALGLIRRNIFKKPCDPNELAAIALYHDATEIFTGDLPTPVKYYSGDIRAAYGEVERLAAEKLVQALPESLRTTYENLLSAHEDKERYELVYAADKLSAYIKCLEERKAGNQEFLSAESSTRKKLEEINLPEINYFLEHFIPSFETTLDLLFEKDQERSEFAKK